MKLAIRPLKGEAVHVEAEPSDLVEDLKKKIAAASSQFPVDLQKLIYQGAILADGRPLSEYSIKDGEFLVCLVAKAQPKVATEAAPVPTAPTGPAATAPAVTAPTPSTTPAPTPAQTTPAVAGGVSGVNPETVKQLVDMGFPEAESRRALQAAFGSAERAVQYLMSGIPAGFDEDHAVAGGGATGGGGGVGGVGGVTGGATPFPALPTGGGGGGGGGFADDDDDDDDDEPGPLDDIRNDPRFAELCQIVAQNPMMLPQILQSLAQTHPELVHAISENQEEFLAMLQDGAGGDMADEDGDDDDAPMSVDLTEADGQAVQRLTVLGFPEELATEAYLACDKNEELAANYLFDSMGN